MLLLTQQHVQWKLRASGSFNQISGRPTHLILIRLKVIFRIWMAESSVLQIVCVRSLRRHWTPRPRRYCETHLEYVIKILGCHRYGYGTNLILRPENIPAACSNPRPK
ncbi:unnamed protein product [Blumeria hordei]|uniref:Uncharacterized protein n=1 Tax=Blumeria hordei TaxID=2867405 RepID=A0A383UM03_BLUHO|nr:unnamed protein product [Blumeria hordei]